MKSFILACVFASFLSSNLVVAAATPNYTPDDALAFLNIYGGFISFYNTPTTLYWSQTDLAASRIEGTYVTITETISHFTAPAQNGIAGKCTNQATVIITYSFDTRNVQLPLVNATVQGANPPGRVTINTSGYLMNDRVTYIDPTCATPPFNNTTPNDTASNDTADIPFYSADAAAQFINIAAQAWAH